MEVNFIDYAIAVVICAPKNFSYNAQLLGSIRILIL
jgi:hypothetical protein